MVPMKVVPMNVGQGPSTGEHLPFQMVAIDPSQYLGASIHHAYARKHRGWTIPTAPVSSRPTGAWRCGWSAAFGND